MSMTSKQKVLFVCIHNSARSQMAEEILRKLGGEAFEVESAGIEPGTLNPFVVKVLKEINIDIDGKSTRSVQHLIKAERKFDYVITVCDETSAERCPTFPGKSVRLHWGFEDPSAFIGSDEQKLQRTREIRDQIYQKIEKWLKEKIVTGTQNRCLSLFLICILALTGCDRIYGLLDKKGAEEKELIGQVDLYEKNLKIEEVQALLKLYGYSVGRPDGILGGQTRKAIIKFQQDNKLEVTRYVDKATWERLNYFRQLGLVTPDIQINIKLVQQILNTIGFPCGQADGKWGERTAQSVKRFQKQQKLTPDGRIGFKTLRALSKYLRIKTTPPTAQMKKKEPRKKWLGIL